jgi:Mg-chelatase subunit ChlD
MALFFRQLTKRFRNSRTSIQAAPKVASGPRRPKPRRAIPAYVLVVDESSSTGTSMRISGGRTMTRMKAIQSAAQSYLQQLLNCNPNQRVAVVGFSDTATLYHPLAPVGPARSGLYRALRSLRPQSFTNLSAGLSLALGQLKKINTTRGNIVVITDGAANVETSRLPQLTRRARNSRVRIFTIGVGNNGDTDYDKDLLIRMARSTGGRFVSAHTYKALCNALRRAC